MPPLLFPTRAGRPCPFLPLSGRIPFPSLAERLSPPPLFVPCRFRPPSPPARSRARGNSNSFPPTPAPPSRPRAIPRVASRGRASLRACRPLGPGGHHFAPARVSRVRSLREGVSASLSARGGIARCLPRRPLFSGFPPCEDLCIVRGSADCRLAFDWVAGRGDCRPASRSLRAAAARLLRPVARSRRARRGLSGGGRSSCAVVASGVCRVFAIGACCFLLLSRLVFVCPLCWLCDASQPVSWSRQGKPDRFGRRRHVRQALRAARSRRGFLARGRSSACQALFVRFRGLVERRERRARRSVGRRRLWRSGPRGRRVERWWGRGLWSRWWRSWEWRSWGWRSWEWRSWERWWFFRFVCVCSRVFASSSCSRGGGRGRGPRGRCGRARCGPQR